jgi:hypothetical protein
MTMKFIRPALLLATTLALAACSDSPSEEPPPPVAETEVPASATASTSAYFSYVGSLPASDTDRPKGVNSVTPPTSETEAPRSF